MSQGRTADPEMQSLHPMTSRARARLEHGAAGARPFHVCFVCNEYPPGRHGGIGSSTQTLARALVRRGHRATVLGLYSSREDRWEDDQGVRVGRLRHAVVPGTGILVNGPRLHRELWRLHRTSPIDVIEGPEPSFGAILGRLPAPAMIRMNGGHHFFSAALATPRRRWASWLERRSFSRARHLCAVSNFVARETRALLGLTPSEIEILPNPIDTDLFQPVPGVPEEDGLIAFMGTLCRKKGVEELVLAFSVIADRWPAARLLLIGSDSRDVATGALYSDHLRTLVPRHLANRVAFHGPAVREALPRLLAPASLCVFPSHMESMGMAPVEAMSLGKAVVVNRTGPGSELVVDEVSGLLCDPHDPCSIARQIERLLGSPELRSYLGGNARARAVSTFSVDAQLPRNESFYRRCAARRGVEE